MADLYDLFSDAPNAQQEAAAMARALRKQQALGQLGMLTGDKVLAPFGQSLVGEGTRGEGFLAQAGGQSAQRGLQRALQASQQDFQRGQQAEEFAFQGKQRGLDRALQRGLETDRTKRAAKDAEADAAKQRFKIEADLRNEFQKLPPAVKAEQVVTAQRQLVSAKPNGVGDLQRIFAFVNLIDPGVAVKQEDVINVGKTGGLPGQAQAYFNQLTAQGTLSADVRKQMEEAGRSIAQAKLKSYNAVRSTYEGLATQYGVDPARAVPNIGLSLDDDPATAPTPPPGPATPPQTTIVPKDFMKDIATKVTAGDVDYYQHKDGRIFTKDAQGNFVDVTPQD